MCGGAAGPTPRRNTGRLEWDAKRRDNQLALSLFCGGPRAVTLKLPGRDGAIRSCNYPRPSHGAIVKSIVSPVFPRISLFDEQRAEANGEIVRAAVVRVVIGPDGQVRETSIWKTSEDDNLDKKTIAAARASKCSPEIVNCIPTPEVYLFSAPFVT
jgi:TonB family protein